MSTVKLPLNVVDGQYRIRHLGVTLLPDERFGTRTHSHGYFVSSGGLSVMIANHVVVRGGIHFHNVPGGEERAFVETSVQVGYRFNPW